MIKYKITSVDLFQDEKENKNLFKVTFGIELIDNENEFVLLDLENAIKECFKEISRPKFMIVYSNSNSGFGDLSKFDGQVCARIDFNQRVHIFSFSELLTIKAKETEAFFTFKFYERNDSNEIIRTLDINLGFKIQGYIASTLS